jgi:hypothetical protein
VTYSPTPPGVAAKALLPGGFRLEYLFSHGVQPEQTEEARDGFFTYERGFLDVRRYESGFLDVRNFSRISYVPQFLNHHDLKPYY